MMPSGFDRHDLFRFDDQFFSLKALEARHPKLIAQIRGSVEEERRFCREHLAPLVLEEDRKHFEDPDHLSWEMVRRAGRHGRLSSFIPKFMGGRAEAAVATFAPSIEEAASVDTAYAGLVGGHGLGLTALMLTLNMKVLDRVARRIAENENSDRPYLIDCAITEPTAGTDVEEIDLYPRARLMCHARRVPGGAVLNGRKVFISTGHVASEHVVLMPFDIKDPTRTFTCFLVPGDAKGFSLGRKERKMGQLASPASELVFEECFVPEENIVLAGDRLPGTRGKRNYEVLLETVLGITRTMVGAISTGNARASFELSLDLARKAVSRGKALINRQWAQSVLTDMFINVMSARAVYLEATFALMQNLTPVLSGTLPNLMNTGPMSRVMQLPLSRKVFHSEAVRQAMIQRLLATPPENNARIQYMSSMAKVVGSDKAMENAHLAVELAAKAGLRHDRGVEKVFRDAKLLQIFEGTNQLNRLNIFKHFVARHLPGVEVF
jgi:acyl-CoA dehydrogenase